MTCIPPEWSPTSKYWEWPQRQAAIAVDTYNYDRRTEGTQTPNVGVGWWMRKTLVTSMVYIPEWPRPQNFRTGERVGWAWLYTDVRCDLHTVWDWWKGGWAWLLTLYMTCTSVNPPPNLGLVKGWGGHGYILTLDVTCTSVWLQYQTLGLVKGWGGYGYWR